MTPSGIAPNQIIVTLVGNTEKTETLLLFIYLFCKMESHKKLENNFNCMIPYIEQHFKTF